MSEALCRSVNQRLGRLGTTVAYHHEAKPKTWLASTCAVAPSADAGRDFVGADGEIAPDATPPGVASAQ